MLYINNISKQYRDRNHTKTALDGVTLTLGPGVHALLGPNGAGKSTLMKLITCSLKSTGGEILWGDDRNIQNTDDGSRQEINRMGAAYRSLLGYAPQQQGLYESFTGQRFLQYMAVLKNIPKKEQRQEIARVAECVRLSDVLSQRIRSYSGGMKQRLLVAQSLLGDPKLLIFDEPTVGLDPNERVRIREYIHAISEGKIVLMATHIVSDVESIADDVILLKSGRVVERGAVEALCAKYEVQRLEQVYVKLFDDAELSDDANQDQ